jgi:hypothetical protein
MPSVKSYQNRKKEIESLRHLLQQYEVYLKNKDMRICQLEGQLNHYAGVLADNLAFQIQPPFIVNTKEAELLKKEIEALKVTLRLYREYILKTYHDADFIDMVEIPNCLKPLDSIKYVGEKSGFNYQS